jgi:hypothetical protein
MPKADTPTRYGGISTVHITTDNYHRDKMGEVTQTMSRTTHKSAYTAMDYALKAQEINTKLLQQTTQAWIDGFRYQAKLSQGMVQVFFGQWENALASMPRTTPVELPFQRQSRSEVTGEPATNGAQMVTETAAKDDQKNTETATFPIEGYDEMNLDEVSKRLGGLSVDELKRVRKYEKDNKNRRTLRKEMKRKIKSTS